MPMPIPRSLLLFDRMMIKITHLQRQYSVKEDKNKKGSWGFAAFFNKTPYRYKHISNSYKPTHKPKLSKECNFANIFSKFG